MIFYDARAAVCWQLILEVSFFRATERDVFPLSKIESEFGS